ncbi:MAG TPA: hypothetical protein VK552_17675 [Reyranella sp.]|nr:hypothetical protein [Reyranella sp.]
MAGEIESTTPESVDVAGAVALMGDLDKDVGEEEKGERDAATAADGGDGDDAAVAEADEEAGEGEEPEEVAEDEVPAEGSDAPEFWSAEDKAAWNAVPPELRPVLKKYEQQRVEFVNEKAREAATIRARAAEEVQRANAVVDQAAQWWQQAGPALQQAFADKWSQVNWTALAEKNPAEWARLNQIRMDEAAVLAEASRRGQQDVQAATARAEQAFQHARHVEHAKLAQKLPDYFGAPETSQKTYDELGKFLLAKGIPADRINQIHEAPIIEMALNAMRFEQAQKRASTVTTANTTARATPTRVVPGPTSRVGNRTNDAARQVGERFRKNGGNSIADAAELIRLNGL